MGLWWAVSCWRGKLTGDFDPRGIIKYFSVAYE
jgi:hypothetical protein